MANEKRLIDLRAIGIGKRNPNAFIDPERAYGWNDLLEILETAPTVDAVPVVRCEKCKHAVLDEEYEMWKCVKSAEYDEESGVWFGFCEYHNGDFFCSYGERKDGDE